MVYSRRGGGVLCCLVAGRAIDPLRIGLSDTAFRARWVSCRVCLVGRHHHRRVLHRPAAVQLSDLLKVSHPWRRARRIEGIIALTESTACAKYFREFPKRAGALSQGFSRVFHHCERLCGVTTLVLVLVLTFYMVVKRRTRVMFRHFAPRKYQPYLRWRAHARLLLVARATHIDACHCASPTLLLILGVEYALVLAIFAGLAEIVPYAGPILAAIPAIILALPSRRSRPLWLRCLLCHSTAGKRVPTPRCKIGGLNPVVSIFSLMVGFRSWVCGRHSFPWPRWLRCSCTISLGATTSVTRIGMFGRGSRHISGPVPSLGADHHFGRDDRCYWMMIGVVASPALDNESTAPPMTDGI